MNISHRAKNGVHILYLKESMVGQTAKDIEPRILEILDRSDLKGIIINMKQVNYVDSSGLSILATCYKQLTKRNLKFGLCQVNDQIQSILKLAKIDHIFQIYQFEEEALKDL